MNDILTNFRKFARCQENISTENNVFKLHYKFSVILLVIFSVLLSSKQYFGDPIQCDAETRKEIINVFCWFTGTFILKKNVDGK